MTDNDIKKALECCADTTGGCEDCPFVQIECIVDRENTLMKSALDLINRQQAEIEKLNVELAGMRGACESYKMHYDKAQAEIERLQKDNEYILMQHKFDRRPNGDCWNDVIEKAKSEAIKEFAERLKDLATSITLGGKYRYDVATKECIDYLVKEMTEVSENGKV